MKSHLSRMRLQNWPVAAVEDFSFLQMKFVHIQYHASTLDRHQSSESTPQDITSNAPMLPYLLRKKPSWSFSVTVSLVLVIISLCSVILAFVILLYSNTESELQCIYSWLSISFSTFHIEVLISLSESSTMWILNCNNFNLLCETCFVFNEFLWNSFPVCWFVSFSLTFFPQFFWTSSLLL